MHIVITANSVVLDLAGFSITGDGSGRGVVGEGDGIAVRNGTIADFDTGIFLRGDGNSVESVLVKNTADGGIILIGNSGKVIKSVALQAGETGIGVAEGIVKDSTVDGFSFVGIEVITGTIKNCTVTRGRSGTIAISGLGRGGVAMIGNAAANNDGTGFLCNGDVLRDNVVSSNEEGFISAGGAACTFIGNVARSNRIIGFGWGNT